MKYRLELVVYTEEDVFSNDLPKNLEIIYKAIEDKKYHVVVRSEKNEQTR